MSKRRTHDSFDAEDDPIGLTSAFAPVKGPQSVDYDTNDDPVGLTQAFGAIPDQDEERSWDEAGKWQNFDWNANYGDEEVAQADEPEAASAAEAETSEAASAAAATATAAATTSAASGPKHGRHAAAPKAASAKKKKAQRTRRVLVVLLILLALVIAAVLFFGYHTITSTQQEAAQQTQEQVAHSTKDTMDNTKADDAQNYASKPTDVPNLTELFGKTQDEALGIIGRGALVTSNQEVNEEGNPIKTNLDVALTDEPADSKTGTPKVYLGLGEDGTVLQVGYSASAAALGFGQLSFADAVNNEHVVEKTFAKVGAPIEEGSVVLPESKDAYSTYGSDGTTVVRERCSFEGEVDANGVPCTWSSVLSYDYTTQVVTGNLNDTVRIIYVYLSAK